MSKRYEVKFYVGTVYDKTGETLTGVGDKLSQAELILTGYFQGATAYNHSGLWAETPASKVVAESGVTYVTVIEDKDLKFVTSAAFALRTLFNQNCVLVTRSEVFAEFI